MALSILSKLTPSNSAIRQLTSPPRRNVNTKIYILFSLTPKISFQYGFTTFETAIKNYLDKRAEDDAPVRNNVRKTQQKYQRVFAEVHLPASRKEQARVSVVSVFPTMVFGLAVHYDRRNDIVVEGPQE